MALHRVSGLELWRWRNIARQQVSLLKQLKEDNQQPSSMNQRELYAEIDWLLQEVAGLDRLALHLEMFKDRAQIQLAQSLSELTQLWQRRLDERVPVQYLVGVVPWRNFSLTVSPAVLIPRPETEYLVDLAVKAVQQHPYRFLELAQGDWTDLGTGSGAIALGLATVFPAAFIHAVDCSLAALAIAQQNAQNLGLDSQIQFYQGFWLEPLHSLKGRLSGIVANPPYIPTKMLTELQPEVAWHEPHLALDGGIDGLDCIRQIIATASGYLQSAGILLLEIMAGQASSVKQLLQQQGNYRDIQIHLDLAGIERFVLAYRV